ncbi:subunit 1 of anaphase-promoting complex [Chloropicon primus]|uniref:Anaphase-promoting complex subunit 1 n=1 Tax=Chloropicon primus TaxID=1764295 RepID=A0A5B8MKD3_9CHLO|nr:subunit 1 of anaphase-promoting complex [Chloropicon primus]|eukprot:QDZ19822.1 subunit 1 of anaphase-promoting complex [Chloropicon primus]
MEELKTAHVSSHPFATLGFTALASTHGHDDDDDDAGVVATTKYLPASATTGGLCEEGEHEVCYRGRGLAWTTGGVVRQTLRLGGRIVDANWARFSTTTTTTTTTTSDDDDNKAAAAAATTTTAAAAVAGNPSSASPPVLCVLTEDSFVSYSGGEADAIALPSPASKIWPLSSGVLLQGRKTRSTTTTTTTTSCLWFLGSGLSELTELEVPGPEGGSVRFASGRGDAPYLVLFYESEGCHRVFRYEYRHEAHAPKSVPMLGLAQVDMLWASYQYPEPSSWIDLVGGHEAGGTRLHLLQRETNQLLAFDLPGGKAGEGVRESFSVPAVAATSVSSSSSSSASKPAGIVVLTPEISEIMLYFGDWCVCRVSLGPLQHQVADLMPYNLHNKFVAELGDGTRVCVPMRLEPYFQITKDAVSALEVALPKELYHEVYGAFLASSRGLPLGSLEEEWECFLSSFSELVESKDDGEATGEGGKGSPSSDWDYLLESPHHEKLMRTGEFGAFLPESPDSVNQKPQSRLGGGARGTRKLSQTQLWLLLESLHALYEDYRLDITKWPYVGHLLSLLEWLSALIGSEADRYKRRYALDTSSGSGAPPRAAASGEGRYPADMYQALSCVLDSSDHDPWLPGLLKSESVRYLSWSRKILRLCLSIREYCYSCSARREDEKSNPSAVVQALIQDSWSLLDLQRLPFGLAIPVQEVVLHCRDNPELDWPGTVYMILNRQDLAANCLAVKGSLLNLPYSFGLFAEQSEEDDHKVEYNIKDSSVSASGTSVVTRGRDGEANDGMSGIDKDSTRLRFSHDLRLKEVRKALSSSCARPVQLPKGMDLSHPETNNVQQTKLYEMAMKTMALPVGRGAFSLSTLTPLPTEPFRIPDLTLSGTLPHQNNARITLDINNMMAQNMLDWPQFHNGVAAGLQLAKGQAQLTRTWIVYNKTAEPSNSHAGFLMALGLQGHLGCLSITDIYRYLSQEDDMTTIGVLLGVSAANIGNMDTTISKMLFLHIPARHPAHYPELELSSLIQAAALVGVGLLYLGSSHRIMTEVLLEEIVRKPNTDNWRDQEGYALAAGIGLGLVNLARGPSSTGLSDMDLEDRLCYFMNGGATYKFSSRMKAVSDNGGAGAASGSSAQVMEDNLINLNVTSPAAAYALGLMYLQTNDKTIASRFSNPESNFALDFVRPDFILLRILFRSLIMWDEVKAAPEWIQEQIPQFLRSAVSEDGSVLISSEDDSDLCDVDPHTIAQCHLYALTGASIALGVRYAGSANKDAKKILMDHMLKLLRFKSKSPDIAMVHTSMCNRANKPTLEQCICILALALSLVMAGTGDLETFKLLRGLHMRDNAKSGRMTYATSMSISLAIGFLFLGGGQLSFCTSPKAIAAILVSLFPHFPSSTTDNRSHLQALRHLYVLGTENRCMDAIDVESWREVRCTLEVEVEDAGGIYKYECLTPTILPESSKIKRIQVKGQDSRYWERPVKVTENADKEVEEYSNEVGSISIPPQRKRIYVKRKLGQSLVGRTFHGGSSLLEIVEKYTSDPHLLGFAEIYSEGEDKFSKAFSEVLYKCLAEDKPASLLPYISMHMMVDRQQSAGTASRCLSLQNMKVAHTFCSKLSMLLDGRPAVDHGFVRACWSKMRDNSGAEMV